MNPGLEKKTKKQKLQRHNKTKKRDALLLSHRTPPKIVKISEKIDKEFDKHISSYSPSVNKDLVSLKSVQRNQVFNCNNDRAFLLKAPLQIGVPDKSGKKTCYPYTDPVAKKYMLKNLKANKHVDPNMVVPPIQELANCWFNTMFVSLFVSDKGRKFFHFLRQMMIEGKQKDVPEVLRDGFALFNYAIDACLTGNKYAYILNTNAIIQQIYDSVPDEYKAQYKYIRDVDEAGNPVRYYLSLIDYLGNRNLPLLFVQDAGVSWEFQVQEKLVGKLPDVIILEFFSDDEPITNKKTSFTMNGAKYALDSCIIRDTARNHFSSLLTCEKKEMAYDGMSFHRLTYMDWKDKINADFKWQFKGSKDEGRLLTWNFAKGYYMMIYYRV